MQIFQLALPLAGMPLAGQALAHKAPQIAAMTLAPARPAPARTDANPAALPDGMAGRGTRETPAALGMMLQKLPAKSTATDHHINRRH